EVLELDHWKATGAKEGRLSVVELVSRAATIESNIISAQVFIEKDADMMLVLADCAADKTLFSRVANIFISTTRVYLQVIVSGSHRQVPEISTGVSRTVELFRDLLDINVLTHLVWPFCFIGCLAMGEDREFVERLADEAVSQTNCPLNLTHSYAIMKECWRLLDEGVLVDPDWAIAMKSLDYEVIL
ncbi:fungal-specific transcription factor domain-containing protein, partial [Tricladium varicosporioides]